MFDRVGDELAGGERQISGGLTRNSLERGTYETTRCADVRHVGFEHESGTHPSRHVTTLAHDHSPSRRCARARGDRVIDSAKRSLGAVVDAELGEHPANVRLDGVDRDVQFGPNL